MGISKNAKIGILVVCVLVAVIAVGFIVYKITKSKCPTCPAYKPGQSNSWTNNLPNTVNCKGDTHAMYLGLNKHAIKPILIVVDIL